MNRASTQKLLKQLPLGWVIGILVLLVGYWTVQPVLNSRLGLQLPPLASLLGEPAPSANEAASNREPTVSSPPATVAERVSKQNSTAQNSTVAPPPDRATSKPTTHATKPTELPSTVTQPPVTQPPPGDVAGNELLYGLLKTTGRQRYLSPAGLQYNPGSEEGHRLKHLERHLSDQPDRPGKHGVFEGDMAQVLTWIDDAYTRGKRKAQGVKVREEGERTVYEAPFATPIGYVGGRDGQRSGRPPAKRLRLVTEGERFITAFPF